MIPLCSPTDARKPTALALGSFDGLHAGHRHVIAEAITDRPEGTVASVVSFWPHPREVLFGEPRLRLDLPSEKLDLLAPLGIEQLVLVPFTPSWRSSAPKTSCRPFCSTPCRPNRSLWAPTSASDATAAVGAYSCEASQPRKVPVYVAGIVEDASGRMSSSRIRAALEAGDLTSAQELLKRPYRFQGAVVQGRGLGRGIGWPTANLQVDGRKFLPGPGVYAAWAWMDGLDEPMAAVMNLGPQPTVDPTSPSAVEVHLLDRSLELVGRQLWVEPVRRLRGQVKFSGLEALSEQIGRDADAARVLLAAQTGVG